MYSHNAHKVQKPSGTDKLVAELNTVPVMLQVFQMCFKCSLSNNWLCEASQQAGETAQVTSSETLVLATYKTVQDKLIS